eukprot:CAMPEP_0180383406 /NCGR_PEP_ID=MMETSP0989-20121125/27939_1 /TAXON_ID=697907 /ORGANISM="non described non described, Strain CCMP2293" /LENGTH=236 /DNA_ID=CAMNT_0022383701 /DNA_START=84 /DNA_END=792 /DNA_ORIENTATION=+
MAGRVGLLRDAFRRPGGVVTHVAAAWCGGRSRARGVRAAGRGGGRARGATTSSAGGGWEERCGLVRGGRGALRRRPVRRGVEGVVAEERAHPLPVLPAARTDMLEAALAVGRFVLARHKSLAMPLPYLEDVAAVGEGARCAEAGATAMAVEDVLKVIEADYTVRQYYVTGKLTKGIYAADCYFDAPDPDMPVRGRRKYVDAISHLFVKRESRIDLLSIEALPPGAVPEANWAAGAQ